MGLRIRIGVGDFLAELRVGIDAKMAALRPLNAVGPVETGVEPLRRVGCGHLMRQQIDHFVIENARLLGVKRVGLDAPVCPASGDSVENLARVGLASKTRVLVHGGEDRRVRYRFLQPFGDVRFGHAHRGRRHVCLAEILLGQNVGGHL